MAPESKGSVPKILKFFILTILFLNVQLCGANESLIPPPFPSDSVNSVVPNLSKIFPSSVHSGNVSSGNDYLDPGEILTNVLINHTMKHGGKEDLDKLIFSTIPEGSKLVLQSVKVYQTDERGNPIGTSTQKYPVHWDIKLTNATDMENDDEDSEEEDEDGDEINYNHEQNRRSESVVPLRNGLVDRGNVSQNDLEISGSHSREKYKTYGTNVKVKDKANKYHHGVDHGKHNKLTNTDTDGKIVTNYKGKEHGITDYEKDLGKAQSNEGERYRDTKKKNKGRRVSGFKRVYHKEEFQRTEHFYDDEDAKRVAESYGLKDAKENSKHGLKDDDRKYHGKKIEYIDGNEVKNEKGTSNKYNKGQKTEYKDSEKHKHTTHYDKSRAHGHGPNSFNAHYHHENHHPSHNYHASYSNPANAIRNPHPNYLSNTGIQYGTRSFLPRLNVASASSAVVGEIAKVPMTASFVVTEPRDSSTSSSTDDEEDFQPPPTPTSHDKIFYRQAKLATKSRVTPNNIPRPDEIKVYYSPRHRNVDRTLGGPSDNRVNRIPYRYHDMPPRTTFRSKIGNFSDTNEDDDEYDRKNYTNYYRNPNKTYDNNERYARKYNSATVRNTLFDPLNPDHGGYSTLVKLMPVKYINLDEQSQSASSMNKTHGGSGEKDDDENYEETENTYRDAPKLPDDLSIESISFTTNAPPPLHRRPPPPPLHPPKNRGRWISISFGDPDAIHDHPFMPPGESMRPIPISLTNIVRGVRQRLTRPRPMFSHGHRNPHNNQIDTQFDTSKYPPNVVVKGIINNATKFGGGKNHTDNNGRHHNLVSLNSSKFPPMDYGKYPWIRSPPPLPSGNNGIAKPNYGQRGSNKIPYRTRTPHNLPPFMNNLMDSVANFFSNVG